MLETNHGTPYFLNLHYRDVAHSMILGRTGSGKSFLLNFLITNLQKYDPFTFIFDLGGSFESLTRLFGGSYLRVGLESTDFTINPFSLTPTKANLDFLALFVKVLLGSVVGRLDAATDRALYEQIENLYSLDPALRTLDVLANTLPRHLSDALAKWMRGGQFGFLFDNPQDTISFSRFQCFDFQQMSRYPDLLEPLLFYILHRANDVIANRDISSTFKAFFIDEAWVFLRNPSIQQYVTEALKTWRKHNAAMILSTQSLDELKRSELLDVIVESCATKIFLANPDMDQDLYRRQFHLNDTEVEWDLLASSEAPVSHQDSRARQGRQSQRRPPQLLAVHERSLRQPEAKRSLRRLRVRKRTRCPGRSLAMIPNLTELGRELGLSAALVPVALAAVLTAIVLVLPSIVRWLDDRKS